jgi:ketol-acid reductoisomerase
VIMGLRPDGKTAARARADGLEVKSPADAVVGATLVAFLTPDMTHHTLFEQVKGRLAPRATLLFAHGFSIHYGQVKPGKSHDVVLIAPKSPGDLVRRQYEAGQGVPCLLAVAQDATGRAKARALAYAHAIGGTRSGVLETSFAEETETDLFGEQAVLCGGATELVVKGYETLVEAGYQPEVAYFECLHELKLIVDLLYEGGLAKMHQFVSETAKYGDLTRGPRIVDGHTKAAMRQVLEEIRSGEFAREWIAENADGQPRYRELLQRDLNHPIERVGKVLRERMAWLKRQAAA